MIKSILCAVDISDPDDDKPVLRRAAILAESEGASLDVMTVLPDYGMSVVGSFFEQSHHDQAVDEAKVRLDALVTDCLGEKANTKVRHIVATGKAYEEILKTAELSNSDLIVIGAHTPDLADYLLGPNAARVVRHSNCSVFVVRES